MGVDLTIYLNHDADQDPQSRYLPSGTGRWYLVEGIRFARQRELWDSISTVERDAGSAVTDSVWRHDDDGLHEKTTDPYGSPLRTLRIGDIVAVLGGFPDLYSKNRAILAYLQALHQDAHVLLWWH